MDKKALFINKTSDWTKKFLSALKSAGWRVEVSPSGMKGVGLAQTNSFNLIIVGDEISDMNPLVVIKNLAGAPSAKDFSILFLCADLFFTRNQGQLEKWKREVRGFVKMPLDEKEWVGLCEAVLENKNIEDLYKEKLYFFEKTEVTQKKVTETMVKLVEKKSVEVKVEAKEDKKEEPKKKQRDASPSTSDLKTLRDYVALKEKEIEIFEADLERAKEQIQVAQNKANDMDLNYHQMKNKTEELEKKCEVLLKENEELRLRREQEIGSRDQENRAKMDKISLLERKLELSEQKYEEMRERVKKDIQKIRVHEKELEARLEILKRDSETLLSAKDRKLLEFRRRIDALEYELESLTEKEKEAQEKVHFWKQRMDRVLRALRMGTSLLEGEAALEIDLEEPTPKKSTKAA